MFEPDKCSLPHKIFVYQLQQKTFFFTTKLAESMDGLDSSLAQSPGGL